MISPDQLRIFRCYRRLPPDPGGMERHIADLTAEQRRQGVEVVSVYNTGSAEGKSIRVLPNIDLHRVKPAMIRDFMFYGAARLAVRPPWDGKVNVLHVHGDYSAFAAATLLSRHVNAKLLVASFHGRATAPKELYRIATSSFKLAFATGALEATFFSSALDLPVCHLPSAPREVFFSRHVDGPKTDVIFVGSLVPIKQVNLLVECAARRPDLRFSVYGDGPERPSIEARIASLGCRNVVLHGSVDPELLAIALQGAKVFLNVSAAEGTPTAALEAMASALPLVLTPSNDYRWLMKQGEQGVLTNSWDPDEIVAAIDYCLGNEPRRVAMGQAARQVAERHRWSAKAKLVTEKITEVLEQAL